MAFGACTEANPQFNPDPAPAGGSDAPGCGGRDVVQTINSFRDPGALDVLIVVSDGPNSAPVQELLAEALPSLVETLDGLELDVQFGVTTGDARRALTVGALRSGGDDCPRLVTLDDPAAASEQLACNVRLGEDGNDLQELMEAAVAALTSRSTEPLDDGGNAGFLRARAGLLVIFASDRDDCSNEDFDFSTLGAPNAVTACARAADDLTGVADLAQALIAVKGDPSAIAIAALAGSSGTEPEGDDRLAGACKDAQGTTIFPGDRLIELTSLLGEQGLFEPACAGSYALSAERIAALARPVNPVVCPDLALDAPPSGVTVDGDDLDAGQQGFIFLGPTDACPNGAIEINAERLIGVTGDIEVRFCSQ